IVKPFVAKDLEDLVAKIEQKLKVPPASEPYEATQKIPAEFQDASYEEWKVTADGHEDAEAEPAETKLEVPEHMASSSAFGDMLGDEAPEPAPAPVTEAMAPPVAEPELETYVAPPPAAPAHEVEFTSAPKAHEAPADGKDPGLITDATEMASAFPTKFGVEGAEVVPVGVAADIDMPELYTESPTPAEAPAEAPVEASEEILEADAAPTTEISVPEARRITEEISTPAPAEPAASEASSQSLELEMQQAFANVPVDTQPPAEEPPPVEAAPPTPEPAANVPDPVLAAAMQAAVAGGASPTITLDANTIANIVHRVTERMKPELISEIARELASEAERTRKP
nr:hypothetical protein [Acidobacteriota bacterium]